MRSAKIPRTPPRDSDHHAASTPLAVLPTPITDAVRLRDALGGPSRCPRILIKRDDLTGLGLGGNKARKLEFLIADALAKGAQTVVTTGAVQSNHARMTAAAARMAGLRAVLVLTAKSEQPRRGRQSAARLPLRRGSALRAGRRSDVRRRPRRSRRRRGRGRRSAGRAARLTSSPSAARARSARSAT